MSLALRRIWRIPALRALLIQLGCLPLTLGAILLLNYFNLPLSVAGYALIQGVLAAALGYTCRLPSWWLAIQLLFPVCLPAALMLHLPSWLFLAGFLLLALVYWPALRSRVPYYPSGQPVRDAVAHLLPQGRPLCVIDIGSGLGGMVLDLARRRPESVLLGIELAPLPWLLSSVRARFSGSRARFLLGDYERLDFGRFDAVFAYLSPAAMSALWRKAAAEMRPGTMLLSYEFDIAEQAPNLTIAPSGGGPSLYVWHF